jgi:hypothetical protein
VKSVEHVVADHLHVVTGGGLSQRSPKRLVVRWLEADPSPVHTAVDDMNRNPDR